MITIDDLLEDAALPITPDTSFDVGAMLRRLAADAHRRPDNGGEVGSTAQAGHRLSTVCRWMINAPGAAQHIGELAWNLFDEAGEDVLLPREQITESIHATDGQFERTKGYIRDHMTMEKGKAFLAYRGGYMITTDPGKIAENASLRMRRINTVLRRVLSGSVNPLGDQVADYEALAMFQDEIAHMTRTYDRMSKATMTMAKPVRSVKPKRRRRAAART